jgi:hypothetical protein
VTEAEPFEDDAVWSSIDDCPQDRGIHSDDYRDYFVLGLLEFVRSGASGSGIPALEPAAGVAASAVPPRLASSRTRREECRSLAERRLRVS